MPSARKLLQGAAIGVAAATVALAAWQGGLLESWEAQTWDWRARVLATPGPATGDIVVILLDQNSLDWAAEENGLTWPWPREVYTAIVEFCRMAGAKALAFDVLFTEPSTYGVSDDRALAAAASAFGRLATAVFLGATTGSRRQWPEAAPEPHFTVSGFDRWLALTGADGIRFPRATFPIADIARSAAVLGSVSMAPDPDGIYRRVPLFSAFDGRMLPALGLAPHMVVRRNAAVRFEQTAVAVDDRRIPMDDRGRVLLRFRGPSGTHQNFSAAAVIQSFLRLQAGDAPSVRPEALQGKYVFFGFSAPGLFDLRPTPVDGVYPGVEIHATVLDNFRSGDFLRHAPAVATAAVTLGLALGAALTATLLSSAVGSVALSTGFVVLPALLSLTAYNRGVWLPVVVQAVAAALAVTLALVVNYATEGRQKRFIKSAFRQYLSPTVIEELIRHPERLKLGGERRTLSIFFSDLQGFTGISEGLAPEALTALLNDYLSAMTDIIHEESGTVDKYEGDAIIAFWNAPTDVPDHAVRIVRAALRCQSALAELRPVFFDRIGKEMHMRIGINTGPAVVGNMGSHTRFDYTMLGDAVNLAARLEGVNKQFGTYTMISAATRAMMDDAFPVRELARVAVVGKSEPVVVYEPMLTGDYDARRSILETFDRGLRLFYAGRFTAASEVFAEIADADPPAAKYRAKCRKLAGTSPTPWSGVWVMTRK